MHRNLRNVSLSGQDKRVDVLTLAKSLSIPLIILDVSASRRLNLYSISRPYISFKTHTTSSPYLELHVVEALCETDEVDSGFLLCFCYSPLVGPRFFPNIVLPFGLFVVAILAKNELGNKMLIFRHDDANGFSHCRKRTIDIEREKIYVLWKTYFQKEKCSVRCESEQARLHGHGSGREQ